jgi:hypothetical protein
MVKILLYAKLEFPSSGTDYNAGSLRGFEDSLLLGGAIAYTYIEYAMLNSCFHPHQVFALYGDQYGGQMLFLEATARGSKGI